MRWTKFFPDGKGGFEAFDWGLEYDFMQVAIKVIQTLILCLLFPFIVIPTLLLFSLDSPTREDRIGVPIAGILVSTYMLMDFSNGWLFCYLFRDNFPDFYVYTNIMFGYSIMWFIIFLILEYIVKDKVDADFNTFEVSPFNSLELLIIKGVMIFLFFYWFVPTAYDVFVDMTPENFSPWFENIKVKNLT